MCCQPTELIWAFCSINFPILPPPPHPRSFGRDEGSWQTRWRRALVRSGPCKRGYSWGVVSRVKDGYNIVVYLRSIFGPFSLLLKRMINNLIFHNRSCCFLWVPLVMTYFEGEIQGEDASPLIGTRPFIGRFGRCMWVCFPCLMLYLGE